MSEVRNKEEGMVLSIADSYMDETLKDVPNAEYMRRLTDDYSKIVNVTTARTQSEQNFELKKMELELKLKEIELNTELAKARALEAQAKIKDAEVEREVKMRTADKDAETARMNAETERMKAENENAYKVEELAIKREELSVRRFESENNARATLASGFAQGLFSGTASLLKTVVAGKYNTQRAVAMSKAELDGARYPSAILTETHTKSE